MNPPIEVSIEKISEFLQRTALFKSFSIEVLTQIAKKIAIVSISSRDMLIKEGDPTDSFYIVMHGRLRAFTKDNSGSQHEIAEIGQEEVVGEIGFLISGPRTATIFAIRNSILLRFDEAVFADILHDHPEVALAIAKFSIKRLVKKTPPRNTMITLAVVPAGYNPELSIFVKKLIKEMQVYGSVLHLNAMVLQEKFKDDFKNDNEFCHSEKIISWLDTQESTYKYIVYEADSALDAWTSCCIRQSDRILSVGLDKQDASLNVIEKYLYHDHDKLLFPPIDVVLMHERSEKTFKGMEKWLNIRPVKNYYHVRMDNQSDFSKLARFMTGHAKGLVLSGGGARALFHIGVLRAFEEANQTFDMVAGSSMGAWIAAFYASGMRYDEMLAVTTETITKFTSKSDYTFPFLSITRGIVLNNLMESIFSDIKIEDLWNRYFCVSTNLTKGNINVHNRGILAESIMASLSLPGILPPIIYLQHQLLLDASVMNNLPVDIMQEYISGGIIIASSLNPRIRYQEYKNLESLSSGWRLLWRKLNPYNKYKNFPNVGQIITNSILLSSSRHQQEMIKKADRAIVLTIDQFSLVGFKSYREIIELGYQAAVIELSKK